jgi:hypothetical protein
MTGPSTYRKAISCIGLRRAALAIFEDTLPEDERRRLEDHIDECASCSEESPDVQKLRRTTKSMKHRTPPADLQMRLRVMASREAQRRRNRASLAAVWASWRGDFRLWAANLMRPIAIPTAGGFFSALLMFGALAPHLAMPGATVRAADDIPTVFYVEPSVKGHIPIGFDSDEDDLTVEISLDEEGRITDYTVPGCNRKIGHRHAGIENQMLFTWFTPATSLGQPVSSKVRVTFRSTRVTVRG